MKEHIEKLKDFAKWFTAQVKAEGNQLLVDRHISKLNSLIQDIEKAYLEDLEQKEQEKFNKENIALGQFLFERIATALENIDMRQNQDKGSFWEKLKKWLSWS